MDAENQCTAEKTDETAAPLTLRERVLFAALTHTGLYSDYLSLIYEKETHLDTLKDYVRSAIAFIDNGGDGFFVTRDHGGALCQRARCRETGGGVICGPPMAASCSVQDFALDACNIIGHRALRKLSSKSITVTSGDSAALRQVRGPGGRVAVQETTTIDALANEMLHTITYDRLDFIPCAPERPRAPAGDKEATDTAEPTDKPAAEGQTEQSRHPHETAAGFGLVPRVYNLFTGFAAKPPASDRPEESDFFTNRDTSGSPLFVNYAAEPSGDADPAAATGLGLVLYHLREILAAGDERVYRYIIMWLAHIVQFPAHKTGIALLFQSASGSGKELFWDWIAKHLFGGHLSATVDDSAELCGIPSTGGNVYSPATENKLLTVCHVLRSCGASERELSAKLRRLITRREQPTARASRFTHSAIPETITDYNNYVFFSCARWPVQLEPNDQHYMAVQCSDEKVGDHEYFERLRAAFTSDTADEFMGYLLDIELTPQRAVLTFADRPAEEPVAAADKPGRWGKPEQSRWGKPEQSRRGQPEQSLLEQPVTIIITLETPQQRECRIGSVLRDIPVTPLRTALKLHSLERPIQWLLHAARGQNKMFESCSAMPVESVFADYIARCTSQRIAPEYTLCEFVEIISEVLDVRKIRVGGGYFAARSITVTQECYFRQADVCTALSKYLHQDFTLADL